MQFDDLRLREPLLAAVRDAGYTNPTPIQRQAIPVILDGADVLGCAQTGTGKTAAFALPLLHKLIDGVQERVEDDRSDQSNSGRRRGGKFRGPTRVVRAAVICPTRELAQQIQESFNTYGAQSGLRSVSIFGGVNQNPQVRILQRGVDIVVATPGRLLDLMNQGAVDLSKVEYLVLDEADHMLDMGFLPDIRRILERVPKQRQSLLFSATMPPPIRKLANDILRQPVSIEIAPVSTPAERVSHAVYHIDQPQKLPLLVHLLDETSAFRSLVFTRTKRGADTLTRKLARSGVIAAAIHGNKSQAARNRALADFRSSKLPVLVATDVAARGIDIDDIDHVFNFDLTNEPETYVHRIGRTGRAGASGRAISFCTPSDRGSLRAIEKLIRLKMESGALPSGFVAPKPAKETEERRQPRSKRPAGKPKPSQKAARPKRGASRSEERMQADTPRPKRSKKTSPRGARSEGGDRTQTRDSRRDDTASKRKPKKRSFRGPRSEKNASGEPNPIRNRRKRQRKGRARPAVA